MKIRFSTEHGSVYELDGEALTWKQLEAGQDRDSAFGLRSLSGPIFEMPVVNIGERVNILAPAFIPGATARLISTSSCLTKEVVE
jgi:hypothetical protein